MTDTAAPRRDGARPPVVLVHGYASSAGAFDRWRAILAAHGHATADLIDVDYASLVHRVTLEDLGEAFAQALRTHPRLAGEAPFDAIVHSTGMLVLRAWMALEPKRNRARVRRLVALAPATFGSPLAHKGRGYLGKLVVGNRDLGPDFLAVGDEILDGLELASRFTWDLAHRDLVGAEAAAATGGPGPHTFVLCGVAGYAGLRGLANEAGSDGTVRLAGAPMNSRKIVLDLTAAGGTGVTERTVTAPWSSPEAPLLALAGLNHGTLLSAPTPEAIRWVTSALEVHGGADHAAWRTAAGRASARVLAAAQRRASPLGRWQQFIVRVVDERGAAVPDWYLDLVMRAPGQRRWRVLDGVRMHVHPYGRDPSLRCFHVDLDSFRLVPGTTLGLRFLALTGTERVRYRGYHSPSLVMLRSIESPADSANWTAALDLSRLDRITFFHPWTTTLVEATIDREPVPGAVLRLRDP